MTTFKFTKITPHPYTVVFILLVMMFGVFPLLYPFFKKAPFGMTTNNLIYLLMISGTLAVYSGFKKLFEVILKATSSLVIENDSLKLVKFGITRLNVKITSITAMDATQLHSRPVFLNLSKYGTTRYNFGFTILTKEGAREIFGALENFEEFKALLKQLNSSIQEVEVSAQREIDQRTMDMAEYANKYRPNSGIMTWFMKQNLAVAVLTVVGAVVAFIFFMIAIREILIRL